MSQTTINFVFKVGGVATDVTSAVLSDPTGAFGVKRTDTDAVVVADGTAMTHDATGTYSHTFTDPAPGLTYNYWVEIVYSGATYRFEKNKSAAAPDSLEPVSYLTPEEAEPIADTLSGLRSWPTATDDQKLAALVDATIQIDAAGPWQGRKYDTSGEQVLEFPRVPYPVASAYDRFNSPSVTLDGGVVWDWDSENNVAVVPRLVKIATIRQADSILLGKRAKRLDAIHDGLTDQKVGSLSESYAPGSGGPVVLCREADLIMNRYRLRSGRIL